MKLIIPVGKLAYSCRHSVRIQQSELCYVTEDSAENAEEDKTENFPHYQSDHY